ncbi:ADP-ribosylation factor-binding protein GGA3 [Pieris rapae]|uniref:ADP-ribosylation factor-binding protein GGA3 n=1 Tax=Pieris rapae TaxID=64459 RepID=UPI001E27C19F|nr:ADP-ribosylation factor-binding protein GGA3 [Pieris rapae]
MNITLTSLEALILKATHESLPQPDTPALEAFCAIMREAADGHHLAAQALASRIHVQNAREALLALSMLDRLMRKGDTNFQAEIGKFRFLNEMIKLVSPKYLAERTAPEVRTRVLQLLHAWSIEYPKETKFKVAFDMLKNQGVIKETPPPLPPEDVSTARPRIKSAIFEDDEKSKLLQKLLQSKKPEDLQHANRLIKTMVKEEEKRNEANSRRALEVNAALDSAGVLADMLDHAAEASPDEEQLIHELHSSCTRLRVVLQHLAASDTQVENLSDILHASDVLDEVFDKYKKYTVNKNSNKPIPSQNYDSLLDFAGGCTKNTVTKHENRAIDDLGDIFLNESSSNNPKVELLTPVSLIQNNSINLEEKPKKAEGWNELDTLGEQLLKQSLPENAKRVENFNQKLNKKIPMNALEKSSPKEDNQMNEQLLDLDFFTKKLDNTNLSPAQQSTSISPNDDLMVDITETINNNIHTNVEKILDLAPIVNNTSELSKETVEQKVKSLADINVTLQSVHPSKVAPLTVFEDEGVTVVLHFCKDKPRPDVNVFVVSTRSKHESAIEDYKFQAVVPKGCKVRLLTSSSTSLPAFNPFLPPPALTQVLLIGRPPNISDISLKFVLTYTCDNEMYSEMGEVKSLPLDV